MASNGRTRGSSALGTRRRRAQTEHANSESAALEAEHASHADAFTTHNQTHSRSNTTQLASGNALTSSQSASDPSGPPR
eukprot:2554351-Rhodomonas_salina.1